MGCPGRYYKKALQIFAYSLFQFDDKVKANKMCSEQNEEILENEIMTWKNKLSDKEFYFEAGRVFEKVLIITDQSDGCDGFNACIGGLNEFCSFLGIEDE